MVEIYKVIAFTPLLNQIVDSKNKNGSGKGANNNNQVYYMRRILNLSAFVRVPVFDDIRKIDI